jgi:hypothetical protein
MTTHVRLISIALVICVSALLMAPIAFGQTRGRSGLPAGPGNPFAALKGSTGLAVYDAVGQKVGDVVGIDLEFFPIVVLTTGGYTFPLMFTESFVSNATVWYASSNCSGQAFLESVGAVPSAITPMLWLSGVGAPGHTIYVADPRTTPLRRRDLKSRALLKCEPFSGLSNPVVPAVSAGDLDLLFSAPFSLR